MVSTFKGKDRSRELLAMQRALGKNGTAGLPPQSSRLALTFPRLKTDSPSQSCLAAKV